MSFFFPVYSYFREGVRYGLLKLLNPYMESVYTLVMEQKIPVDLLEACKFLVLNVFLYIYW